MRNKQKSEQLRATVYVGMILGRLGGFDDDVPTLERAIEYLKISKYEISVKAI